MLKKYLIYLLIPHAALAGLPPTSTKGQSETSPSTTFFFQAPYNQYTTTAGSTRLLETGNNNLLVNPSFEHSTATTGWTKNGSVTAGADTTNPYHGKQSLQLVFSAINGDLLSQSVTPSIQLAGVPVDNGMAVKTSLSGLSVCSLSNNVEMGCTAVPSDSNWHYIVPVVFSTGTNGTSMGVKLKTTTSVTAGANTLWVDAGYSGISQNIGTVAQASFFGGMEQASASGCSYAETTSSGLTNFVDLGTGTGCNTWSITTGGSGTVAAVGTNDHRITLSNVPPGALKIDIIGKIKQGQTSGGGACFFQLSDGTNSYQAQSIAQSAGDLSTNILSYSVVYSTAQSSVTLKLQAADNQTSGCALDNSVPAIVTAWKIYYFPTSAQSVVKPNLPVLPTIQKFTSGSGTYTTPAGVSYIKVRLVGAGGGGGGGGSSGGSAGGTGGTTTFGTTLLSAVGGTGGGSGVSGQAGGAGGTASLGTGPAGTALTGATGTGGNGNNSASGAPAGGQGGNTMFGGGGGGAQGGANGGFPGQTNTGGGGGGGGAATSNNSGGGGGGGGSIDSIIVAPLASYAYTVGAGGTAGGAGTTGGAGGAGGSGYIEVTEYYQGMNAPVLVGGVVSPSSGTDETAWAIITNNGTTCSVSDSGGAWIGTLTRNGTGRCSFAIPSGIYSRTPACTCAAQVSGGVPGCGLDGAVTNSSTNQGFITSFNGTATDTTFKVICMGPK